MASWRAGYDSADAESVASAVDSVPTFPVVGPPGIDPDATTLYPGGGTATQPTSRGSIQIQRQRCRCRLGAGALGTPDSGKVRGDSACHDRHVDGESKHRRR